MIDGLDYVGQPNTGEEIEDLDLFSNVGGMDLGEDGFPLGKEILNLLEEILVVSQWIC